MAGYYIRKHSWAASWCQGIAVVCIPYYALAILLHRFGYITSPQAFWLIAVGLALIFLTLALGVRAFMDHWHLGMSGGPATMRGICLAILMLAPYVWYGYLAMRYPLLSDVSTNSADPPAFGQAADIRKSLAASGTNDFADYDAAYGGTLEAAYPELGSHSYPSGSERVLKAVLALMRDRSWRIIVVRGVEDGDLPSLDDIESVEGAPDPIAAAKAAPAKPPAKSGAKPGAARTKTAGKAVKAAPDKSAGEAIAGAEPTEPKDIYVEAVAASRVFGFERDVVVAIVAEAEATVVDMRSSSRYGPHDFGANAGLIEDFLDDLDKSLFGSGGQG